MLYAICSLMLCCSMQEALSDYPFNSSHVSPLCLSCLAHSFFACHVRAQALGQRGAGGLPRRSLRPGTPPPAWPPQCPSGSTARRMVQSQRQPNVSRLSGCKHCVLSLERLPQQDKQHRAEGMACTPRHSRAQSTS